MSSTWWNAGIRGRVLVLASGLVFAACGESVPSEALARKAIEPYLAKYGDVVHFEKTNGEPKGENYLVYFWGASRVTEEAVWVKNKWTGESEMFLKAQERDLPFQKWQRVEETPVPRDSFYVIKGTVVFRKTEKGWLPGEWNRSRFGFCPPRDAKVAKECYTALDFDVGS